ncbi:hypothetical protein, partial [Liquorilactobacillus sicerae]|uniref:hypothetical protein n=1 Tax=Liquorilactobacillus sicerae TaxID=1416943 RepID=UPI0024816050
KLSLLHQKSHPFRRTDSLIIQLYQLKLQVKQFYLSVLLEKEPFFQYFRGVIETYRPYNLVLLSMLNK